MFCKSSKHYMFIHTRILFAKCVNVHVLYKLDVFHGLSLKAYLFRINPIRCRFLIEITNIFIEIQIPT